MLGEKYDEKDPVSRAISSADTALAEILKGSSYYCLSYLMSKANHTHIKQGGDKERASWETPGVKYTSEGQLVDRPWVQPKSRGAQ